MAEPAQGALKTSHNGRRRWRPQWTARMALIPAMTITIVCFYGFIIWTFVISLTRSRLLPIYKFTGFDQYVRLFANERWWTAMQNIAIHGFLFIGGCIVFGYLLAILIDRGIKAEGMFSHGFHAAAFDVFHRDRCHLAMGDESGFGASGCCARTGLDHI